ncbi:MAG: hypothetical protein LBU06_01355, partial [Desulfovibrio sp.]|nr:hypothetical protein [Desulfovibrio sp.]
IYLHAFHLQRPKAERWILRFALLSVILNGAKRSEESIFMSFIFKGQRRKDGFFASLRMTKNKIAAAVALIVPSQTGFFFGKSLRRSVVNK